MSILNLFLTRKLTVDMGFGFQNDPAMQEPYHNGGIVIAGVLGKSVELSPDEARLYALKLIKAADKAEDD